jgi:hypothetical protein
MFEPSETAHQRRRHKAVYLAPSAGNLQQPQNGCPSIDLSIPLLVEVPQTPTTVVSPPSSVGSELSHASSTPPPPPQRHSSRSFRYRFCKALSSLYYVVMDFLLLVFVCLMGLFFDVEVQVVKLDRRRARARGRSGRIVIQTRTSGGKRRHSSEFRTTNLLRQPSRTGDESMWRHPRQDFLDDNIV